MHGLILSGTDILKSIGDKNEELEYLINLGEFMCCYVTTGRNAKIWYKLSAKIKAEDNAKKISQLANEMKTLIISEKENAEKAIEFVRRDSRLGWEPTMEYMGGEEQIRWKIKHLEYVLEYELSCFEKNYK